MHYLYLAVLASTIFGLGLKVSETRGRDRLVVALFNYLAGIVIAGAWWVSPLAESPLQLSGSTILAGIIGGIVWVVSLIIMMVAIRETGIAITAGVSRLSVILPIIACVFFWQEELVSLELVGVGLALVAVLLLGSKAMRRQGRATTWGVSLLVLLLVSQAAAQIVIKVFERYCPATEVTAFMLVLFITAAAFVWAWILVKRLPFRRGDMLFGALLGLPNLLSGSLQALALQRVKGTIVFPVVSAGVLFLLALAGLMIWREKLGKRGIVGILLTIIALVLINLTRG